jgi:hypothetical protein
LVRPARARDDEQRSRRGLAHNRDEEKEPIGYASRNATSVDLYLEESFTFQVLTEDANVWLRYKE